MSERRSTGALDSEIERLVRGAPPGCFAYLAVHELTALEVEHGPVARDEVFAQLTNLIEGDERKLDVLGVLRHQRAHKAEWAKARASS